MRSADTSATPHSAHFEDLWPSLSRAVRNMLTSKRVPRELHEDIEQETAARLWERWHELDTSKPLSGLAVTIALNLSRDHARVASSHPVTDDVPDVAAPVDVERSVLARLELRRVGRALRALPEPHRAALMTELDHSWAAPHRLPGALRVLRFRARRGLEMLLDRAGYALAPRLRIQELVGEVVANPAVRDVVTSATSGLAAATLTAVMSLGGGDGSTGTRLPAVEPRDVANLNLARNPGEAGFDATLVRGVGGLGQLAGAPRHDLAELAPPPRTSASSNLRPVEGARSTSLLDAAEAELTELTRSSGSVLDHVRTTVSGARVAEITKIGKGVVAGAGRSPLVERGSDIVEEVIPAL